MQSPTGGKAHEPQGMIRCNSEADSIVWMKEEKWCAYLYVHMLKIFIIHTFYALNVLFEVFFNGEIKFKYYLPGGEKS